MVLLPLRSHARRMQYFQIDFARGQAVAGLDNTHWYPVAIDYFENAIDARRVAVCEGRCATDLTNRKAIQQRRQAIEVIEVGMRNEDLVDAADALVPEERCDVPAGHFRAGHGAGIVEN